MVRAIVNQSPFLGRPVQRGRAVWFTEQGRPTFAPLLQKAGLYNHPDLFVLYNHDVLTIPWPERVAGVVQVAKQVGATVIVVDTLSKLAGIRGDDENGSGPMMTALDYFEPARAAGITVVVLGHDRKSGGGPIDASRGSNALPGEADVIFQLVKDQRLAPNARRLRYAGRLDTIADEQVVTLGPDGYQAESQRAIVRQKADEQRAADWSLIASVLRRRHADGMSPDTMIAALDGKLGRDKTRRRLAEYREAVERSLRHPELYDEPEPVFTWTEDGRGARYFRGCDCHLDLVVSEDGETYATRTERRG
jgi:hypothetical protein